MVGLAACAVVFGACLQNSAIRCHVTKSSRVKTRQKDSMSDPSVSGDKPIFFEGSVRNSSFDWLSDFGWSNGIVFVPN